jgi:YD repeat-containing protein
VTQTLGYSNEMIKLVYVPQTPSPSNGFATHKTIVNDCVGNVSEHFFNSRNQLVCQRAFTGRADPTLPTTDTANRPTGQLRPDDPPFFETRYQWNADSLLTQVVLPNSNQVHFVHERDLDQDAKPLSGHNLRIACFKPGPKGADQTELKYRWDWAPTVQLSSSPDVRADRLTRSVDPSGNVTLLGYDTRGNCVRIHRPSVLNYAWDIGYNDISGQVTNVVYPADGTGYRRRDAFTYYGSGPQKGYLHQRTVDAGGLALNITYAWDLVGNPTAVTDALGRQTLYTVNALNQIVQVRGPEVAPGACSYRWDFDYDLNNNLVRRDVENRDENGVLQANTRLTTIWDYDALNLCTRRTQEKGSANLDNTVLSSAAIPVALREQFIGTEFAYDANCNLALVRHPEAVNGRQLDNVVQFRHDERDLLFKVVRARQATTQFDYDGNGNCVRTTLGLEDTVTPRVWTSTYDGYNRRTSTEDAMGSVVFTTYDANGNPTRRQFFGELVDAPGSAGNRLLAEQRYSYDALNRLTQIETAHFDPATGTPIGDGVATTRISYAPNSALLQQQDDRGNIVQYEWDLIGRPIRRTDAKGNQTAFTYDAANNVVSVEETAKSDSGGLDQRFLTTYVRDALGRVVQYTDSASNIVRYAYNSRNHLVAFADARGNVSRDERDGLGRLVATTRFLTQDGTSNSPVIGTIVNAWDWNDNGLLTAARDGNSNVTRYAYDPLDRLIVVQKADGTLHQFGAGAVWPLGQASPNLTSFLSGYNMHGDPEKTTDANGTVVTAQYDRLGRLVSRHIAPGPGVAPTTTQESYQWNGRSRLVRAQDNNSDVRLEYDSMGNRIRETSNGQTTTQTHDGVGNVSSRTYPSGLTVSYTPDALNRPQTVIAGAQSIAAFRYVGPDRVERVDSGNGVHVEFVHDGITGVPNPSGDSGVKRLVRSTVTRTSDGATLDAWSFRSEPETFEIMASGANIWAGGDDIVICRNQKERANLLIGSVHDYGHDSVGRLVQSVVFSNGVPAEQTGYVLDAAGNRIQVTGTVDSGSYVLDATLPEPADRQMNQPTQTPFDTREYDRNGNLCVTDLGLAAERTFVYDFRNRLVSFHKASTGETVTFRSDVLGRRMEKTVTPAVGSPQTTRYLFSGPWEIEQRDGAGAVLATLIRAPGGRLLAMQRGGQWFFFHADQGRNTTALTDRFGNVVERYDYGDFGKPQIYDAAWQPRLASAVGNDWLAGGWACDQETGLIHVPGRYLDPRAGRFITR